MESVQETMEATPLCFTGGVPTHACFITTTVLELDSRAAAGEPGLEAEGGGRTRSQPLLCGFESQEVEFLSCLVPSGPVFDYFF